MGLMNTLSPSVPKRSGRLPVNKRSWILLLLLPAALLIGCQALDPARGSFGLDRRDRLVQELDHTNYALLEVQRAFGSAKTDLEEFENKSDLTLRERHVQLSERYSRCEEAVTAAKAAIANLENGARRFFLGWDSELFDYTNPEARKASRIQLEKTRGEYETMIAQVRESEQLMTSVVSEFRDYISFLRHNLNVQEFSSLNEPSADLEARIELLIEDLSRSLDATDILSSSIRID